jgi:tyrosine-protein phosphatase YwqE
MYSLIEHDSMKIAGAFPNLFIELFSADFIPAILRPAASRFSHVGRLHRLIFSLET